LDVIRQISAYAKFLKDMCTSKIKLKDNKSNVLTEQVNSILKFDSPPKFKDADVPPISCYIGNNKIKRAVLDLSSSVNLISYFT